MLDIRATAYIAPVSEVPFESVPLTVSIANFADEAGYVTGKFRVYNSISGLLIHTSAITPITLLPGQTVDVSALTTFDPPAPATSTYFVNFDGFAKNELVPDGINFSLGSFYFDVLPVGMGPAPAGHHATHEAGGSDEVDCTGLAGTGAAAHAASHEEGGADELEVARLATAELDDTLVMAPDGAGGVEFRAEAGGGAPAAHAASHQNGGADEISVAGLSGTLADAQTPTGHHASHEAAGTDVIDNDAVHFAKIHPAADSTTAVQVLKADNSTPVVKVDTTNGRVGIGMTPGGYTFDVTSTGRFSTSVTSPSFVLGGVNWLTTAADYAVLVGYNGVKISGYIADSVIIFYRNSTTEIARFDPTGQLGIGTGATVTALLDVNSDKIRLRTAKTPASAGAAGNAGDICWDADYIYVCVATNTWKRVAIATW